MLFKLITHPDEFWGEIDLIIQLFEEGLPCLHLRKPHFSIRQYEDYLLRIPQKFHKKIMLHQYHHLADHFKVMGIHFNKNNSPENTRTYQKKLVYSTSIHSYDELFAIDPVFNYVFLSPVFDSISKAGYKSNFSNRMILIKKLAKFHKLNPGIQVVALGGISIEKVFQVSQWGFDGFAVLGGVWEFNMGTINFEITLNNFRQFLNKIKELNS